LRSPLRYLQAKRCIYRNRKGKYAKALNKDFEKATLRIKGVKIQKKLIICYDLKFKALAKFIKKKSASLPKAYRNCFQ